MNTYYRYIIFLFFIFKDLLFAPLLVLIYIIPILVYLQSGHDDHYRVSILNYKYLKFSKKINTKLSKSPILQNLLLVYKHVTHVQSFWLFFISFLLNSS